MQKIKGQNFVNLKLLRKDKVKTQGSSKQVIVNPQQMSNRM